VASIRKRTWTARGVGQSKSIVDYFDQAGQILVKLFTEVAPARG